MCADGSAAWSKDFGGKGATTVAAVDAAGNVYAGGNFGTGIDFGGGPITTTGLPPFIVKYDSNGTFQWANHATTICAPGVLVCNGQVWSTNISSTAYNAILASWAPKRRGRH